MLRYCRFSTLLVAALCALLTAAWGSPWEVTSFHLASVMIYPLVMCAIWYLLQNTAGSRDYGVALIASSAAFLALPVSTTFGPILPALTGLAVLAIVRRDPFYFAGVAVSLVAVLISDNVALILLGAPARGLEPGPDGAFVYVALAAILAVLSAVSLVKASPQKNDMPDRRQQEIAATPDVWSSRNTAN